MNRTGSAGFSLVEVIVAIAVLGVILVAVGGLMTGNLTLRRSSNQATEAIQISTSYLEAIKRHWSVLDNWVDGSLPPTPVDPRAERYSFLVELTCLTVHGVHLATCPPIPELRQVVILAETGTDQVERLVTQIGRPFEPRGSR